MNAYQIQADSLSLFFRLRYGFPIVFSLYRSGESPSIHNIYFSYHSYTEI